MVDNAILSNTNSFFMEYDKCSKIVSKLCSTVPPICCSESSSNSLSQMTFKIQQLQAFRSIIDKYLECPTLLDPHLESMITQLATYSRTIIHEYFALCTSSTEQNNTQKLQRLNCNISFSLSALESLCKVRGYKKIQKFLPHEVDDLEPVLFSIRHLPDPRTFLSSQDLDLENFPAFWESTFILFTWLEVLSLLPFDLFTLDSSLSLYYNAQKNNSSDGDDMHENMTLMNSIIQTCKFHLGDTGKTREAAASCLARLLTRPDLEKEGALETFVEHYAAQILNRWTAYQNHSSDESNLNDEKESGHLLLFSVMGVVQTLVHVFKAGARTNLINLVSCMETIWEHCIILAQDSANQSTNERIQSQPMVLRKLLVKLFARVGCAHLKPRIAEWRYQRGSRSLLENLSNGYAKDKSSNGLMKDATTIDLEEKPREQIDSESSYFFEIPPQIEDTTGLLLYYLQDPSTNIRYTAAKNLGRITERLPQICSFDILNYIFELFHSTGDDDSTAWHGACLALAELARRGLLLPDNLGDSVEVVLRAMSFDKRKHTMVVIGAQVRDAACYVCWAFSRAYSPEVLAPYIRPLTEAMLCTALFDRELNCRRAASAAFQEFVGRMGGKNVEHGIDILTKADYFAVGKREVAFRKVAFEVANLGSQGEGYRRIIVSTLADRAYHWDTDVRVLVSKALGDLSVLDIEFIKKIVLTKFIENCTNTDLYIRHGSILAVAEIVFALGNERIENNNGTESCHNLRSELAELVVKIEKERLYRGKGGEIMRCAVARLIECISIAKLKLTVRQQVCLSISCFISYCPHVLTSTYVVPNKKVKLLDSVDIHLKHPNEQIQKEAVAALHALTRAYFPVGPNGPSERLQKRVVDNYIQLIRNSENVAVTRGFTLALGSLPRKLLAPNHNVLAEVIDCLCDAAKKDAKVGLGPDAETRRNSINALSNIVQTVGIETMQLNVSDGSNNVYLNKYRIDQIFDCLLSCMDDYNTDRRGDVGSWSRIAALSAIETLLYLSVKASLCIPQKHDCSESPFTIDSEYTELPPINARLLYLKSTKNDIQESTTLLNSTLDSRSLHDTLYFDDERCEKVMQALFKQLSEKLDAVRHHSGSCLERILLSKNPIVPFIPQRELLLEALSIENHTKEKMNWANPKLTFPLVMRAVNITPLFDAIISGMVISVGGLTESVVKNSKDALFEWIKGVNKDDKYGSRVIGKFGEGMLFGHHFS